MTPAAKLIRVTYIALLILALLAPMIGLYPVFVMKLLCFAIFASKPKKDHGISNCCRFTLLPFEIFNTTKKKRRASSDVM